MRKQRTLHAVFRRTVLRSVLAMQSTRVYRRLVRTVHPPYRIVEATADDLHTVYRWFDPEGTPPPRPSNPVVTDYVARSGKAVVGYVQAIYNNDQANPFFGWWAFSVQVRLRWRAMGIGRALCERILEHARAAGAHEVSLIVRETNQPAVRLYTALGFKRRIVPDLDAHLASQGFPPERHLIVMSKDL